VFNAPCATHKDDESQAKMTICRHNNKSQAFTTSSVQVKVSLRMSGLGDRMSQSRDKAQWVDTRHTAHTT